MISVIRQFSSSVTLEYAYQFARQDVVFNEPIDSLSAFEIENSKKVSLAVDDSLFQRAESLSKLELLTLDNSELCYQGQAQFDQQMRSIDYWRSGNIAQIDVDGVPSCRLDLKLQCIVILNELPFDTPFNIELITGPALILLLSNQSIFCLHAGAVSFFSSKEKQVNVAFLADSGVGKSTLSRDCPSVWHQLCDDILPVRLKGSSVELFDDFPQLKLDGARIKNKSLKNNKLDCIVFLNSNVVDEIKIEKMPAIQSVLAIIRHTVASRLFDQDLLMRHCEFAQSLSREVSIFQVSYPRNYAQLPELRQRIIECIE